MTMDIPAPVDRGVEFFVLRHGERIDRVDREWKKRNKHQLDDPPLTDEGHRMAAATAEYLRQKGITHIYCSPFTRTLQTALPVSAMLGIPVRIEEGLAEWNWTNLFTRAPQLVHKYDTKTLATYNVDTTQFSRFPVTKFPESWTDVAERYRSILQVLWQHHAGANHRILLVSHSPMLKTAIRLWASKPGSHDVDYCALCHYSINANGAVTAMLTASVEHLRPRPGQSTTESEAARTVHASTEN